MPISVPSVRVAPTIPSVRVTPPPSFVAPRPSLVVPPPPRTSVPSVPLVAPPKTPSPSVEVPRYVPPPSVSQPRVYASPPATQTAPLVVQQQESITSSPWFWLWIMNSQHGPAQAQGTTQVIPPGNIPSPNVDPNDSGTDWVLFCLVFFAIAIGITYLIYRGASATRDGRS